MSQMNSFGSIFKRFNQQWLYTGCMSCSSFGWPNIYFSQYLSWSFGHKCATMCLCVVTPWFASQLRNTNTNRVFNYDCLLILRSYRWRTKAIRCYQLQAATFGIVYEIFRCWWVLPFLCRSLHSYRLFPS